MKSLKRPPWFTWPATILVIGIGVAGFVLYDILADREKTSNENASVSQNSNRTDEMTSSCGNGVCEDVACLSTNCPAPETAETCPQDCQIEDVGSEDLPPDDRNNNANDNQNQNTNQSTIAALDFSLLSQSSVEAGRCPLTGANMSPADAVAAAQAAGMHQGVKNVTVGFGMSDSPLDQCIWTIRNFQSSTSGIEIVLIDSTQDFLRTITWTE